MLIERLAIIGLGLIGGSLARALRQAGQAGHIGACDHDEAALRQALQMNVIDDYSLDIKTVIAAADVVVLATPPAAMAGLLTESAAALKADAVLTDVGSVKGSVVAAARAALGPQLPRFVPGHPIAGTERSGLAASFAELFSGRRVILTPLPETGRGAYQVIAAMWRAAGAEVVAMEAGRHDAILAASSHLPHLLAYALVDCLAQRPERDEIFSSAAGGFADFTRIASSNPELWHDICFSNRAALLHNLGAFADHIRQMEQAIASADGKRLLDIFRRAKQARDQYTAEYADKSASGHWPWREGHANPAP